MKKYITLAFASIFLLSCSNTTTFADYVNPLIGTGGHGHTFPGATLPFGMVQLSPDTRIDGSWDGCSGYHYSDSIIYGFSHTHLSGTGVSDYGDILLMPTSGKASFNRNEYSSTFSHDNETARAGYYSVTLDNGIAVELTTTTRVGFHKYKFPKGSKHLVLDLEHRDELLRGEISIESNTKVGVKRISKAWATEQHAYAFIEFSLPYTTQFNKEKTKVIFTFDDNSDELLVKCGFSFVDIKGAENNLNAELPHWNFKQTQQDAKNAWNKELGKIEVEDNNQNVLQVFYSALYHVMIHPNIAMDVDRRYRGRDNAIHVAEGFDYYTVFSLWDTFRAAHPLFTIIDQKRTLDFIKTFLAQYEQGGRLPVWELASNETDCMIGYHSVSVIADAIAKGITDFDVELAFEAMKKSATWNHLGLPAYMEYGFLSIDDEHESVSKTLEYAYDDWCIAQVAQYLNNEEDYQYYMMRSNAWRNLLDPETKLMRPRKNGGWLTPFEPSEVNNHFTEANAWQYSFFVPHDIEGMIEQMGGKEQFEAKLDELFSTSNKTTGRTQVDITGLIGQYAHGNEPSHHMAYLYNYIGKPHKTENKVHKILREFYTTQPDGLIGNEDCGQMSAWYVLSAMGLYSVTPGMDAYTLTSPFLTHFKVHLENGNTFTKRTITDALRAGKFISHFDLTQDKKPNTPSFQFQDMFVRSPIISAKVNSFNDSLNIEIHSPEHHHLAYYTINDAGQKTGVVQIENHSTIVTITQSTQVVAYAFKKDASSQRIESKPTQAKFYKNPHPNWDITILSKYNPQYSAGGDRGIIDGILGTENWRKGDWQGYQNQDFEAIIDFGKSQTISLFSARFLQDSRSWILMPTKVEFYISNNGKNFTLVSTLNNTLAANDYNVQIKEFKTVLYPKNTRYVKVKAYNYGTLPQWHQGYGGEAFIFVDEVVLR
jgi:predicted alpha-1,2-mannosidase